MDDEMHLFVLLSGKLNGADTVSFRCIRGEVMRFRFLLAHSAQKDIVIKRVVFNGGGGLFGRMYLGVAILCRGSKGGNSLTWMRPSSDQSYIRGEDVWGGQPRCMENVVL